MRRLGLVMLITVMTGLVAPSAAVALDDASAGSIAPEELEAAFVADTNRIRAEHGLAELPVEPNLVAKARDWSATMASAGKIWHSDLSDGITIEWARLGENVGKGGSVESLQAAFVDSPLHYQNIIDVNWQALGIGVTVDEQDTIFVAVEFVEYPDSAPAPADTSSAPPPPEPVSPVADAGTPEPASATPPAPVPEAVEGAAPPTGAESPTRLDLVLRRLRLLDG